MYQKILICFLVVLCFSTCKDKKTNVIVDVDDDFTIDMFENIDNGVRNFQLDISTISPQTCLNYTISYDLDFNEQDNNIELTLNELIEPDDCIQGTSTTSLTIPFGSISEGTYRFDLNLKDAVINQGQLSVTAGHYLLEMESNDGIEILNPQLNRIPNNTIWGYVAYDNSSASTDAQDFLSNLQGLNTVFNIENNNLYSAGYFGYFQLGENKELTLPGEINFNFYKSFIFQHDSDNLEDINQVMLDACGLSSELEIFIFNDKEPTMSCN